MMMQFLPAGNAGFQQNFIPHRLAPFVRARRQGTALPRVLPARAQFQDAMELAFGGLVLAAVLLFAAGLLHHAAGLAGFGGLHLGIVVSVIQAVAAMVGAATLVAFGWGLSRL